MNAGNDRYEVTVKRIGRTGSQPVRRLSKLSGAVAASLIAAAPFALPASPAAAAEVIAAAAPAGRGISDFYAGRQDRPLWIEAGRPTAAAHELVQLLSTAQADGLNPEKYDAGSLARLLAKAADGDTAATRKAERMLSNAFAAFARDLRNPSRSGMTFIDARLRPGAPPPRYLLEMAASAPSLERFVRDLGWMNPAYAPLRRALVAGDYEGPRQRELLRINLDRVRALPASLPRYVVVNAAEQRLYMFEGDQAVDSMNVVVGKQKDKDRTPMLASFLSQASLNPYWNVPPDLAAERIAPNVLKLGLPYLKKHGYQVLSDWGDNPEIIDPASIDWQAVADGTAEVRVRQVPGPGNALGKVKYTFANPYGVYLHDTPDKQLLTEETRLFSGGCIRLEDASRLGKWLFGRELEATSNRPDIKIDLDEPVPVYVTYLTAVPKGSSIAFLDDVYGWDEQRLAQSSAGAALAAR